MDPKFFDNASKFLTEFNGTNPDRLLGLLVSLAELGFETAKNGGVVPKIEALNYPGGIAPRGPDDVLIGPQTIQKHVGVSWRQFKETLLPEHGEDVESNGKDGKACRYYLSDVLKIRDRHMRPKD